MLSTVLHTKYVNNCNNVESLTIGEVSDHVKHCITY